MSTQKDFPFKVGQRIFNPGWTGNKYMEVLYVGTKQVFIITSDGDEEMHCYDFFERYLPYSPPKKTIRMAPALVKQGNNYTLSYKFYKTYEEAKIACNGGFIQWPANDSMWVDVPVED